MSGHNKWSKIKRKKAVTDAEKSRIYAKHVALIAMEARRVNGDLSYPNLQNAIERARKDSVPKDNIERAVAKGSGVGGEAYLETLYETFGPGGVAILITAITDNNNRTSNEIRHLLNQSGYNLGAPGSAVWAFTKSTTGYTPNTTVNLNDADGEALARLIELIEEQAEVQDIYTTADDL